MLDHFENSDGLGAIFPPMIYTVIALKCLGYDRDSAPVQWALRQLDDLLIEEDDTVRVQPCVSPVWDTAIATIALADAGLPDYHPALLRAVALAARQGGPRRRATGRSAGPGVEPSGWHFQYRNELYPDIDDTAMVLLALQRTAAGRRRPRSQAATRRGVNWLLAMQNRDGGWAAFDVDIDNEVLTKVPFADHNAMLDPSCADITARVLELLGTLGYRADHPAVARALDYLWRTQEPQGCWYGRWGVNYIYGTWQVLQGLKAHRLPDGPPARSSRRPTGSNRSSRPTAAGARPAGATTTRRWMGQGEPTASQTAWAVLGLIAAGRADGRGRPPRHRVPARAPSSADGTWDEARSPAPASPASST